MAPPASVKRRLCIVAAVPISLTAFMAPHIRALRHTSDITLVAGSCPDPSAGLLDLPGVRFHRLHIARHISIVEDIRALVGLWRMFRRERFDVVQSITPKAGFLAMAAAKLAGIRVRVHWFTGQVWATRRGPGRSLLKMIDRVLARTATHLLADSASQRAFVEREGIVKPGRIVVLADGSVCGVNPARFKPDGSARRRVRLDLGIDPRHIVALYLGRVTVEKGLPELAEAFARTSEECPDLHLLIVGPDEGGLQRAILRRTRAAPGRVHFVGETQHPEVFMAAADFFVLPSHREGFGSSVIEAAACGVPAIATTIYGLTDAVVQGQSGLLVPVGDVAALSRAMRELACNGERRRAMGEAARARVELLFNEERLTAALADYIDQLLPPEADAL